MAGFLWTAVRKALVKKTVKDFNKAVRAARKAVNPLDIKKLPNPITQSELMKNIASARDLTNVTNIYKRFTETPTEKLRKNARGWAEREAKRLQQRRNKAIEKMREYGGYDPLKGNTQKFMDEGIAFTRVDVTKLNPRMLDKYIKTQIGLTTQGGHNRRIEQYKKNMLKRIDTMPGVADSQRNHMKYLVKKLSPEQLMDFYYNSNSLNIGFLYPVPGEEYEAAAMFIEEMEYMINKRNEGQKKDSTKIKYVEYSKRRFRNKQSH